MSLLEKIWGGKPKVASAYTITGDGEEELQRRGNKDPNTIVLLALQTGDCSSPGSISRATGLPRDKVERALSHLSKQGLIRPVNRDDYD